MRTTLIGWILAILTAAVALTSALVYLATGTFTRGWVFGVVVAYGAILVAAILLLAFDVRAKRDIPVDPSIEPILESREVVYRTHAGEAIRLTYAWPDARREVRHTASAGGEILTHTEIETYVDALAPQPEPADLDRRVDAALAREAARPRKADLPAKHENKIASEATPDA